MGTILYTTDPNATTGFREATFEELIAGARHALAIRVRKGAVMASPNAARDYLTMRLAPRDHEVFTILFLDSRHRLIDCLEIFRGTIGRRRPPSCRSDRASCRLWFLAA